MSAYNVKKRGKDGEIRKGQYYVWYLGWKECRGIAGREFTEPIVKDLVMRRKHEDLPKLTIDISKKELRIYQLVKVKLGRTEKLKFPTVPAKDVTYAVQCLPPDEDVVACIYLGFNPTTRRAVHVHVYRCDSPETASIFVDHLMEILRTPEHQERLDSIEDQLVSHGEVVPRPKNFVHSYDADSVITTTPSTVHTVPDDQELSDEELDSGHVRSPQQRYSNYEDDPFDKEKEVQMESLATELKRRLGSKTQVPILLPPQDYDTLRRIRGNMELEVFTQSEEYENRKCKNEDIVGVKGTNKSHGSLSEDLFINNPDSILNTPNGVHEGGSGSSNGSSRGPTDSSRPVEMRSRVSVGSDERKSRGSRGSGIDTDIQVVSPRWKTTNQVYSPPGRPTSPHPFLTRDDSRSLSPGSSDPRRNPSPSPRSRGNQRRRSPSPGIVLPGAYASDRRGRGLSPGRPDQPRYRSGSRGRYYDSPQVINPYPSASRQQLSGRVPYTSGNRGVDVVRLPRTPSAERYPMVMRDPNPNLSHSMPASALHQYTQAAKGADRKEKKADKKDKDKKKKNRKSQEPVPDYTMHPSAGRKMMGSVYS